jgi:hypothetical protein
MSRRPLPTNPSFDWVFGLGQDIRVGVRRRSPKLVGKRVSVAGRHVGKKSWADMAQFVGRLTALKVLKIKKPGMYADGAGLYLQVTGDGDASRGRTRRRVLAGG